MWVCAHDESRVPGPLTREYRAPDSRFAGSDTDRVRGPSCRAGFHRSFSPLWRWAGPSALRTTVSPRPQPETLDSERAGVRTSVSWDAAPPLRAPRPAGRRERARPLARGKTRTRAHLAEQHGAVQPSGLGARRVEKEAVELSRANRQLLQPISFSGPCYARP